MVGLVSLVHPTGDDLDNQASSLAINSVNVAELAKSTGGVPSFASKSGKKLGWTFVEDGSKRRWLAAPP